MFVQYRKFQQIDTNISQVAYSVFFFLCLHETFQTVIVLSFYICRVLWSVWILQKYTFLRSSISTSSGGTAFRCVTPTETPLLFVNSFFVYVSSYRNINAFWMIVLVCFVFRIAQFFNEKQKQIIPMPAYIFLNKDGMCHQLQQISDIWMLSWVLFLSLWSANRSKNAVLLCLAFILHKGKNTKNSYTVYV